MPSRSIICGAGAKELVHVPHARPSQSKDAESRLAVAVEAALTFPLTFPLARGNAGGGGKSGRERSDAGKPRAMAEIEPGERREGR